MYIILMWNGERTIYDAGLITRSDGEVATFGTMQMAQDWCDENDSALGAFSKVIDLDA